MYSDEEIWKDIVGFEGYYQVSNHGRVRSLPRKVLGERCGKVVEIKLKGGPRRLTKDKRYGYHFVVLTVREQNLSEKFSIAPLVLETFVSKKPPKDGVGRWVANHKDGNFDNLHWSNLEWIKQEGENAANAQLTVEQVKRIRKALKEKAANAAQLSREMKVSHKTICNIANNVYFKSVSV